MPDLTTLISIQEAKGGVSEPSGGASTAPVYLDQVTVAGSAGFGNLSKAQYYTGRSIYYQDPSDTQHAERIGLALVKRQFKQNKWSAQRALKSHISKALNAGISGEVNAGGVIHGGLRRLSEDEEAVVRNRATEWFQLQLVRLAHAELRVNGKCQTCYGTGRVRHKSQTGHRTCEVCHGTGRADMSAAFKQRYMRVSRKAWETWSTRYDQVFTVINNWKGEYEAHLIRQMR